VKIIFFLLLPLIVDQALKFFSTSIVSPITILPHLLYFHPPFYNPGIAFGWLSSLFLLTLFLSLLAIIFLTFSLLSLSPFREKYPLLLLLAGAGSNLIDRIWRGGVVDYLQLHKLPWSFNLADLLIIWGSIHFLILSLKKDASHSLPNR